MGLAKEKREFLVTHFGEERVSKLEELIPQLSKELEEQGIGWKEFGDAMGDPDPKPDPKPEGEGNGDDDDGNGNGDGDEDEAKVPVTADAIKELLGDSIKTLLEEALAPIKEDIKQLQKTDDEKIADKMSPRSRTESQNRPSESKDTEVDGRKLKGLEPDPLDGKPSDNSATARARELVETVLLGKR